MAEKTAGLHCQQAPSLVMLVSNINRVLQGTRIYLTNNLKPDSECFVVVQGAVAVVVAVAPHAEALRH